MNFEKVTVMRTFLCFLTLSAGLVWAADPPKVSGAWTLDSSQASKVKISSLEIHQTADSVEVNLVDPKEKKLHLACELGGQQCKVSGEAVSFWYNGPALVMMEMRHNNDIVIKTRLVPSDDGKTMQMEVTHIAPQGKAESFTLTRGGS
jgi:hypothetical protein